MQQPTATTTNTMKSTMDNTGSSKSRQLHNNIRKNYAAVGGEGREANGRDDFADATHTHNVSRSSSKRSGPSFSSDSDIRNLQKVVFNLSEENEKLKELLERIQRESAPKCGAKHTRGGDAKIEEAMKDLKLEQQQQQQLGAPQLAPLSDCSDTSNEYEVPQTIDISDRSGESLDHRNLNDMENIITGKPKQQQRKKMQFNYCSNDDEGPIDYYQIYS